jgi:hypothetical protein
MSNVFTHAELKLSIQLPNCVTHSLKGESQDNKRQHRFGTYRKYLTMKQISEVEGKPFTSSLNICPEKPAVERGGGGRSNASPLFSPPYFPDDPWIFHFQRRRTRYSPPRCFLHLTKEDHNGKCRHLTFDHEPDMSQGGGGCKEGCSSLPLHPTYLYRWPKQILNV